MSKRKKLRKISSVSPLKDTEGLSSHEIITLCTIVENRTGPTSGISLDRIIDDMRALGYNKLAVNLSVQERYDRNKVKTGGTIGTMIPINMTLIG